MMTALLATALLVGDAQGVGASIDWLPRFKTEGVNGLKELEAACDDFEAVVTQERISSLDAAHPRERQYPKTIEVLIHRPWLRVEIKRTSEGDPEVPKRGVSWVSARNSRYSFGLRRRAQNAPYVVEHMGGPAAATEKYASGALTHSLFAPWRVFEKSIPEWLNTPGFTVKQVRPVMVDGKQLAEVTVVYANPEDIRKTDIPAFSGVMLLDPERRWCVCQVDCVMHHMKDGIVVANIPSQRFTEFGPPVGDYPMPKVVRGVIKGDPASPTRDYLATDTYTITKVVRRTPSEREFSLSHFGLPEIGGHVFWEERSFLWLWLALAAVLLGFVAIVLGLRYRRIMAESA